MKVSLWSIAMLAALFFAGFVELSVALYNVQVVNVARFKRDLAQQATRRVRKPGIRGRILDSKGGVIAESRARRDIVCDLSFFRKNGGISNTVAAIEREVARLSGALGKDRPESLTSRRIARHIRTASAIPMCVWRDLDEFTLARFEERAESFPGFSVESHAERIYPRGTFAAHLVGYTGRDRNPDDEDAYMLAYELEMKGRSGLEAFYDDYLAGVAGAVRIPVDARVSPPTTNIGLRLQPSVSTVAAARPISKAHEQVSSVLAMPRTPSVPKSLPISVFSPYSVIFRFYYAIGRHNTSKCHLRINA